MGINWAEWILFAQEAQEIMDGADGPEAPVRGPGLGDLVVPFALTLLVFYFLIILPERKRSRQKQGLLEALKKNDKVVTVGGIYGIVANVKPGEDEVVIRIDEDKDVKIKVSKASIAKVLTKEGESA